MLLLSTCTSTVLYSCKERVYDFERGVSQTPPLAEKQAVTSGARCFVARSCSSCSSCGRWVARLGVQCGGGRVMARVVSSVRWATCHEHVPRTWSGSLVHLSGLPVYGTVSYMPPATC